MTGARSSQCQTANRFAVCSSGRLFKSCVTNDGPSGCSIVQCECQVVGGVAFGSKKFGFTASAVVACDGQLKLGCKRVVGVADFTHCFALLDLDANVFGGEGISDEGRVCRFATEGGLAVADNWSLNAGSQSESRENWCNVFHLKFQKFILPMIETIGFFHSVSRGGTLKQIRHVFNLSMAGRTARGFSEFLPAVHGFRICSEGAVSSIGVATANRHPNFLNFVKGLGSVGRGVPHAA
jgi:hypothetical protein